MSAETHTARHSNPRSGAARSDALNRALNSVNVLACFETANRSHPNQPTIDT
jgi:hypothetical protein